MAALQRIGSLCEDDFYLQKLLNLRQTSSVNLYQLYFEMLRTLVAAKYSELDEAYFVSCCLNGLKEEIRRVVQLFRPSTTHNVLNLALLQESVLAEGAQNSCSSPPKSAEILSTQPLSVCKTRSTSDFVDETVGEDSMVNEETDVDTEKCLVVCDKVIQIPHNFDLSPISVETPPAATSTDTLGTVVVQAFAMAYDESGVHDINLMEQQTNKEKAEALLYDKALVPTSLSDKIAPEAVLNTACPSIHLYLPRFFDNNLVKGSPKQSPCSVLNFWCFDPGIIHILLCGSVGML